jgi:hypothetical protein
MNVVNARSASERRRFHAIARRVHEGNPHHRDTEASLVRLLVDGPTAFHRHAEVHPCLLREGDEWVGRCALVHDRRLPEVVQVAFFEALPGLRGVADALRDAARSLGTGATTLVVGLNGHLNYGAGVLLDRFDESPVFGLPYSPPHYAEYFAGCRCRRTVSYRFPLHGFFDWHRRTAPSFDARGITVRPLDKRNLRREIAIYTAIDNETFFHAECRYWSNRDPEENHELFHPFRFLVRPQHLLFAEKDGRPIGFMLWYPDFNGLAPAGRDLGAWDVIRYAAGARLPAARLTEIAILPQHRSTPAVAALFLAAIPHMRAGGHTTLEGGFIFEENRRSITMTERFLERATGSPGAPYRSYGIFEAPLA